MYFQKLKCLSLRYLKISPKPLQLFTEAMHHITTLDLSFVLHKDGYDDVIRAISLNMPNLKELDMCESLVQPSALELLLPTKRNPQRGCPKLASLNLLESGYITVELLKKIVLRLPKLRCLKHELLVRSLAELTEEEMDDETGRCLTYVYSIWLCGLYRGEKYYVALTRAPMFTRLSNITEIDIVVREESEHLLKDVLMRFKTVKRLTLSEISNFYKFLLPALECNVESCLEYLCLYDLSGDFRLSDVITACPRLEELSVHCDPDNKSDMPKIQTSNGDRIHTCLRKVELEFMDEQLCSQATLVSLLKSPRLAEISLSNVEAMSNNAIFNYLSFQHYCAYVRSSKVKKISLKCCLNITEEPFVHWLAMEDCMLEFLSMEFCSMVNYNDLKEAAEKYPKALCLLTV